MKTVRRIATAAGWCRLFPQPLVFVPTMGALHEGHVALIRRARRLAGPGGSVVVSIFVNPKQFGPREDFTAYPRPFSRDRALCTREGVTLLFHPLADEMYAVNSSVTLRETVLSTGLCGTFRPGHFDGVCTVVAMLFNVIRPDLAVFGEKDWQQLAVIRRMVRDLKMPVKIVSHPIVREEDGLALSSRNRFLTPAARSLAPRIHEALVTTAREAGSGEASVPRLLGRLRNKLSTIPGAVLEYAEIVDHETLVPLKKLRGRIAARVMVALRMGKVRLIDNMNLTLPHENI